MLNETDFCVPSQSVRDAPHKCTTTQPQAVYKVNDEEWCETFCIPESLVKVVEQFGDVKNGTCPKNAPGYSKFDHSLPYALYGVNVTVDMYKHVDMHN